MIRCLSTYVDIEREGYSPTALRRLSDRRKFPHQLEFVRADVIEIRARTFDRMSISGVQEKVSLRLDRGHLSPVSQDGQYILKPVPGQTLPAFANDAPANESLTMQLAEQVFHINTAANGLIYLADRELAYITRRFDRTSAGKRIAQEDFCQLMGRTPARGGSNYKYDGSYEELAAALRQFVPAYAVEVEKLFRQIVFNYAFGNGDAHLKNFSLQQVRPRHDYILSPAYDLMCTTLHLPTETHLALDLLADDEVSADVAIHGHLTGGGFLAFAARIGVRPRRAKAIVDQFTEHTDEVDALIERSFLSDEAKGRYGEIVCSRRAALAIR